MTLTHIILANLAAGVLSLLAAAWLSMRLLSRIVKELVSVSAGLLLGTAILQLLPEAFEGGADLHRLCWTLLAGLIGFFMLEKLAILRHSHHHEGDGHDHHHGHDEHEAGPGGLLILVGDSIHNFVDGVLIAAAFLTDVRLGWLTAVAIAAHEIPQEIGDFIVLLNAGYTRKRAFVYNLLSGLAAVVGGIVGYFALQESRPLLPYVVVVAAASFIYVALADLVPDLQRSNRRGESLRQFLLLVGGIAVVALLTTRLHQH
ncbi:MAG TPA: ZIP family metal transporter [Burkholderiaceae bacterium]|nr:ZIP family metal transporter [Burkholderiaceae bacterium]